MSVISIFRMVPLGFLILSFFSTEALSQYTNSSYVPPERRHFATDVTGYDSYFEYLDAAMFARSRAPREDEPIDDAFENLRNEGFSCLATSHVIWDGSTGSAESQFDSRSRFVVECDGNCKGVRYRVGAMAMIVHLGLTQPVPVLDFKAITLGNVPVKWQFTRPSATGNDLPDIYIHHWAPGSFNYGPGCRAPKPNNIAGSYAQKPADPIPPNKFSGDSAHTSSSSQQIPLQGGSASPIPSRTQLQVPAYQEATSGRLYYHGPPVPQNGEVVFGGLPPGRLNVLFDRAKWVLRIEPGANGTQRIILRSEKPGMQKKVEIFWSVSR